MLLATLKERAHSTRLELEEAVVQLSEAIRAKLNRVHVLIEEIQTLERRNACRDAARAELKQLKQSLRGDWKAWSRLCGQVLDPNPATA